MSRFNEAFDIVIGHEGGYTRNPKDRGNWTDGAFGQRGGHLLGTKYGIAAHVYPHLDIPNLTIEQARQIYKENYWDRAGCDNLPDALALCVFDTAINSGVSRALQLLTVAKTPGEYLDARLRFLRGLSSWATFGRGWSKRVEQLRAQAAQWATSAPPALPVPAPAPAPSGEWVQLYDAGTGKPLPGEYVSVKRRGTEFRLFKVPRERLKERGLV